MLWSIRTIVCNYNGKFQSFEVFIPRTPSEDSHRSKGCGSVSLKYKKPWVSVAPKPVARKYIFKVMMTIFRWYFPPVNHCRAGGRRPRCSEVVLLQAHKPLGKLKWNCKDAVVLCSSGRIVWCHFRIPRRLVEQDCKTLDALMSPVKH